MSQEKSQEKTEEEKPKHISIVPWKCLCEECPGRDKCYDMLKKSGALKKLGITNPAEMQQKMAIAFLSFLAGVATDEIIRSIFKDLKGRKRFFRRS